MGSRRSVATVATAVVALTVAPAPTAWAEVPAPDPVTSLQSSPGARPGEISFRWTASGRNTDYFLLETATTPFDLTVNGGRRGRAATTFFLGSAARSFTLSATQTREAGAGLGTGNHLYFQLLATNQEGLDVRQQGFGPLQAAMPRGLAATRSEGAEVRAGTFNVRTAKARTDRRTWLQRRSAVAQEIVDNDLDVVALQELSPGRADGRNASSRGRRQTTTLLAALDSAGGGKYQLVRSTPYVRPGRASGSQGTRILYNTRRFNVVSDCPETTGRKKYNDSCTISLPLLPEDGEGARRRAAYAMLEDQRSGRRFLVVSAHLDARHSRVPSEEARFNRLRGEQAAAIVAALPEINPKGRPVVFGGDINSWQTNGAGNAPHETLVADGFFDAASAARQSGIAYNTSNRFSRVMLPSLYGFGSRIDAVMVKGAPGADYFENVLDPVSEARPSDHSLVLADLVL